jgi:acyl carrier protein
MSKENEVIALIAEILEINESEISVQTAFVTIPNWDSLAHLQIIAEFEDAFKVKIPIEKMPEIKTVQDLLSFIQDA